MDSPAFPIPEGIDESDERSKPGEMEPGSQVLVAALKQGKFSESRQGMQGIGPG